MIVFKQPRRQSKINAWLVAGPFNPINVLALMGVMLLSSGNDTFGSLFVLAVVLIVPSMIAAGLVVRKLSKSNSLTNAKIFGYVMLAYIQTVFLYSLLWVVILATMGTLDGDTDFVGASTAIVIAGSIFGFIAGFIPAVVGYFSVRYLTMEPNRVQVEDVF